MAFERCHDPEELQRLIGSSAGLSASAAGSSFEPVASGGGYDMGGLSMGGAMGGGM
jgi:hypothetical protein